MTRHEAIVASACDTRATAHTAASIHFLRTHQHAHATVLMLFATKWTTLMHALHVQTLDFCFSQNTEIWEVCRSYKHRDNQVKCVSYGRIQRTTPPPLPSNTGLKSHKAALAWNFRNSSWSYLERQQYFWLKLAFLNVVIFNVLKSAKFEPWNKNYLDAQNTMWKGLINYS